MRKKEQRADEHHPLSNLTGYLSTLSFFTFFFKKDYQTQRGVARRNESNRTESNLKADPRNRIAREKDGAPRG